MCIRDSAYGGYVIKKLGKIIAKENFTKTEMSKISTYRELLAVKNVLTSLSHVLKNETVQWFSDNSNFSRIINSGSTKSHLQEIVTSIYNTCIINNIRLFPQWIPREQNTTADKKSKTYDALITGQ